MAILREYHTSLGPLVHKYEGTVERFIGDGFLVIFNDPLPCPDPSVRAIKMAGEMRACMGRLADGWRKHGHDLGFGIGIAHGYATLGRLGFEGRFEYSAIGTVVNLAARLCAQAEAGQILIDPKVHSAVEPLGEFEPAGELTLKGLSRPIKAFKVGDLRAT